VYSSLQTDSLLQVVVNGSEKLCSSSSDSESGNCVKMNRVKTDQNSLQWICH